MIQSHIRLPCFGKHEPDMRRSVTPSPIQKEWEAIRMRGHRMGSMPEWEAKGIKDAFGIMGQLLALS